MNEYTIIQQLKCAGIEYATYQSDVYVPVNEATAAIVSAYEFKGSVTTFIDQITGQLSFEIPFVAYDY